MLVIVLNGLMVYQHFNNGVHNIIDLFYIHQQQQQLKVLINYFRKILTNILNVTIANQYLIKSDLLSYTSGDELQHIMDIFIREVRRSTGDEYLPESIYYLCLGIY